MDSANLTVSADTRGGQIPDSVRQKTGRPLRVFLVDDHAVVREGVKALVNRQADMTVVGEAATGQAALEQLRQAAARDLLPDVIVIDISMTGITGVETTARIRKQWPDMRVLGLSMHEDKSYFRALMEAGASGYLLKRSAADELIRAIRVASAGETYLDPALTGAVIGTFLDTDRRGVSRLRGDMTRLALSEREESVLRLIASGISNKEIAAQLKVSVKTVETHKARSMEKLALDSRADIVRFALAQGWLK